MRWFALAVTLLFTGFVQAQSASSTAAHRVFDAWLEAFNSGEAARYKAFDDAYQPARPMAQMEGFRKQTGGFTLVRVEKDEPTMLVALLKERASDNIGRAEFRVSADDPPKLLGVQLRLIPPPADLAPPRLSEAEALAALGRHLDEATRDDQFSGAVLVARHGKVLLEKAWGRADREGAVAATPDTQFRLGSMNKMFTAIAILQLVEAGKLALDDTVGRHLAGYPNQEIADKVTIRHLLTHTGGTGDIFGTDYEAKRLALRTHADYVKLYGARGPAHAPGAAFRYSNYGYVLLGAIIEQASGLSYYDYVRQKIFLPAGMTRTDSLPETERVAGLAHGYLKKDGKWVPNSDTLPWRGTAAGGGYSTVGDLLRFVQALQGGKLVSRAMLAQATRAQSDHYGFGFGVGGEGAWQWYGHNGGAPGMNAELRVIPRQDYVLVALSNFDPPAATRVVEYMAARLPGAS